MNLLFTIKSNVKKVYKKPGILILPFVIPFIIFIVLGILFDGEDTKNKAVAVVNSDAGEASQQYCSYIDKKNTIQYYSKDEADEKLKNRTLSVYYEIPDDFTEQIDRGEAPVLNSYMTEKEEVSEGGFEWNSNCMINALVMRKNMANQNIDCNLDDLLNVDTEFTINGQENMSTADRDILHVAISFLFFESIILAMHIFNLKRNNVWERSYTTPNTPLQILGGIFGADFILLFSSMSIAFIIQAVIRHSLLLSKLGIIELNLAVATFIALSLGALISNICKSEALIFVITQLINWVTCFIGGSFAPLEILPEVIRYYSRFMPQYWILDSINNNSLASAGIAFLYGFVFLGCVAIKKHVNVQEQIA